MFFAKLEYAYEPDPVIRKTYANIRMMLMDDTERKIGCPYQVNAITMDCRGNLLYCAPKSPTLGNARFHSAQSIYLENIPLRKKILQNNCKDCI
ncbi:radical SAM protein, partial [bacterium]|nr:radical SAM protein [bacterium]